MAEWGLQDLSGLPVGTTLSGGRNPPLESGGGWRDCLLTGPDFWSPHPRCEGEPNLTLTVPRDGRKVWTGVRGSMDDRRILIVYQTRRLSPNNLPNPHPTRAVPRTPHTSLESSGSSGEGGRFTLGTSTVKPVSRLSPTASGARDGDTRPAPSPRISFLRRRVEREGGDGSRVCP